MPLDVYIAPDRDDKEEVQERTEDERGRSEKVRNGPKALKKDRRR
jgi:hypothetical protein